MNQIKKWLVNLLKFALVLLMDFFFDSLPWISLPLEFCSEQDSPFLALPSLEINSRF